MMHFALSELEVSMSSIKGMLKQGINRMLTPLGLEIKRIQSTQAQDAKAEGFPGYLAEANKRGMDVNDWIEQELKWEKALPILEQTVFPYLRDDSVVCELGAGTGRHARHIASRLRGGELRLVDHSPWSVAFLRNYFQSNPRVSVHLNDGCSLPFRDNSWADLIFSNGTFIELKLGLFYLYSREFWRVLKPGGYCVFDYIDATTPEGWKHLESFSAKYWNCFTYHTPEVVDKVFTSAGFEIVARHQIGKSTYLVVRKPVGIEDRQ